MKTYICIHCKSEQTEIGASQDAKIYQKYDIETQEYQEYATNYSGEECYCLNCDKDFTSEDLEKMGIDI